LGPEGGRPGRPTQPVRHTCSGNLEIVKILRYIRSDMYAVHLWQENRLLLTFYVLYTLFIVYNATFSNISVVSWQPA